VDELSQGTTNIDMQNLYPLEDYIADLHAKLEKAKENRGSWTSFIYGQLRYSIFEFASYWFRKLIPGLAFAFAIAILCLGIGYIRNKPDSATPEISVVETSQKSVAASKPVDTVKQNEPDSRKYIVNFYLKEHKNAVIKQASLTDQPSHSGVAIKDDDVLYYDTIMGPNKEEQGEAGLILRAPRRSNATAQGSNTQTRQIPQSYSLSLEQAKKSVSFKITEPQTLYPGYLLESIKKLEGKDCLHLVYTNGINTLSVFEQLSAGESKLHSGDFKEYIMYSKKGDDPENIIGWHSGGVSFTVIGNEDFPQLINITREIQESN